MDIRKAVDKINRGYYVGEVELHTSGYSEVASESMTTDKLMEVLSSFHATWVGYIATDEYRSLIEFADIISEGFTIEIGYSEALYAMIGGNRVHNTLAVVTGNESGTRRTTVWEIPIIEMTIRNTDDEGVY